MTKMAIRPMATGTAKSHMLSPVRELLMGNEVGGGGDGNKTPGVAVDQQDAGADRQRCLLGTGAGRHRMPVAEDVLETNPAGQSLIERPDRDGRDLADEIGVAHRVGLVARNDAGDAAACGPD